MPERERAAMKETMTLRAMKALTHPGDGVGVIAGMSINLTHIAGMSITLTHI